MRRTGPVRCLTAILLASSFSSSALAAANNDPDWPCIQRKVPELSLGQIWNGPDLPEASKDWSNDEDISDRVKELAARRLPLPEAQKEIKEFAATLPPEKLEPQLTMLVQGLFDHMNAERSHVISGIARYAHKQLELATALRKESSDVDALRNKPDADQNEVTKRTDQLTWQTRVFEERVQSLTYVCEVPTLIEQRLYQLAKTVAETLPKK
ncbi:hypothetical protein [Mesorhizobium sp. DCY119]|uniref:hypothetical protein n=1 Tax=Mesorhizobium sp. DCY119 TaxID=2108445 RepID=UPI000E6D40E2|nr:hypothetical protein [Mesorhizobium sp. DCY119]RJG44258.1 hypothetical protein D3Y55_08310 [Mesorhizobium sp. DCY119]